jgi:signal transduction histidine kinase
MAIISSFLVYTSQQDTEVRVELVISQILRQGFVDEVREAAANTESKLDALSKKLQAATNSQIMFSEGSEQVPALVNLVRSGLEQYIVDMLWLDKTGIIRYAMNETMVGTDASETEYYKLVRNTNQPSTTEVFVGSDKEPYIALSAPIPTSPSDNTFNGALVAMIYQGTIQSDLNSSLQDIENNEFFIIDKEGQILGHSRNSLTGKIFDEGFLNMFASETRQIAGKNFRQMIEGKEGSFEYVADGQTKLFAYEPIQFRGEHYWSLAVVSPMMQTKTFALALAEQRAYTIIAIVLIAAIAAIFIALILSLNKRLQRTVKEQDVQIRNQLEVVNQAYEKLKEQDAIKDVFINSAAHELRTPVLPIILNAEELSDDPGTSNPKVEIILRNAKRLNKLINNILDISRIESNTFKLQKEKANITELIKEAIQDTFFKISNSQGSEVQMVFESSLPEGMEVMIDKTRISEVLLNLLDNAVKFTRKGTISVILQRSRKNPNHIEIKVVDTGEGIDSSIKYKLFQKFATKAGRSTGTGLGLYLSKAIVEAHDGMIWAEDRPAGKGAVFSFTLPAT